MTCTFCTKPAVKQAVGENTYPLCLHCAEAFESGQEWFDLPVEPVTPAASTELTALIVTLNIDYDLDGAPIHDLATLVRDNIFNMIGNGGLSGSTEATVNTWSLTVFPVAASEVDK